MIRKGALFYKFYQVARHNSPVQKVSVDDCYISMNTNQKCFSSWCSHQVNRD